MKKVFLLSTISFLFLLAGCTKKNDPKPEDNGTKPPSANLPYYFDFNLANKAYSLKSADEQYVIFDENEIGGYLSNSVGSSPIIRLAFRFPSYPSHEDVLKMTGFTYYFDADQNQIRPEIMFEKQLGSPNKLWSVDSTDMNFYVKINSIKYLKEFKSFYTVDTYLITGTCSALINMNEEGMGILKDGKFNMVISRVKK